MPPPGPTLLLAAPRVFVGPAHLERAPDLNRSPFAVAAWLSRFRGMPVVGAIRKLRRFGASGSGQP